MHFHLSSRTGVSLAHVAVLTMVLSLGACGGAFDQSQFYNAPKLKNYMQGRRALERNKHIEAIAIYENIIAYGQDGNVDQASRLELGHAILRSGDPARAIREADAFIEKYPASKNVGYAHVLGAVAAHDLSQLERRQARKKRTYNRAARDALARLKNAFKIYPEMAPGTLLIDLIKDLNSQGFRS